MKHTKQKLETEAKGIMPSMVIIDNPNKDKIKVKSKFDLKLGLWRIKVKLK